MYATMLDNPEEMNKLLEFYNLLRLNQKEVDMCANPIGEMKLREQANRLSSGKNQVQLDSLVRYYH